MKPVKFTRKLAAAPRLAVSLLSPSRALVSWCALASAAVLPASAATTWAGYMNVFNNSSGSRGSYVFGSPWGVSDLKTTVNSADPVATVGDQLVLQPNFNTYADSLQGSNADRAFWTDSSDGGATAGRFGNKWMDSNVYIETSSIATSSFTLDGRVDVNDLSSSYLAEVFIKVLDPAQGYATVLDNRITLPASGTFTLNSDLSGFQGKLLQTGFSVNGLNANPIDQTSLGSVQLTIIPEPSSALLAACGALGALSLRSRSRRGQGTRA